MIKAQITDAQNNQSAEIDDGSGCEPKSIVVATRELKTYDNQVKFFSNDTYGIDMNQNAAAGGTPDKVHDGTDTSLWTATDVVGGGKTTFNNAERPRTGSLAIKVDNSPVNDVYQFAKGSDIDLNNYASITMWIQVDKDWKAGDSISIYAWDTDIGIIVGNEVFLEDYFTWGVFDTYHKITIPLEDMGLDTATTVDAIRVKQVSSEGKAPKYYIDDVQIEETGTPIEFLLLPSVGTWLHVESFTFSMADEFAGTLSDGTMSRIPYDSILGETLSSGLLYQRTHDNELAFSTTIKTVMDIMQLPQTSISGTGSDGTNTWITIHAKHTSPFILKPEHADKLSFYVSDDLTGLLQLRITAGCREEIRGQ